ncbi:MAG: hypothetical protein CMQ05_13960 [Gammaproteobacteria bacterium]|nr:hypothetical protein [Gammaproteobacteria bacterium]
MLATGRFRPVVDSSAVVAVRQRVVQRFDQDAALLPADIAFAPSYIAVFHACSEMALRESQSRSGLARM